MRLANEQTCRVILTSHETPNTLYHNEQFHV